MRCCGALHGDASDPVLRIVGGTGPARLLARVGKTDPASLDSYRAAGGYQALARAIELGPEGVIAEVAASRLLGRGGAAFPTARKWDAVRRQAAMPHYVVCNADESEPGHLQGSRAARERSVRGGRGDDHLRPRDLGPLRLPLHPWRVSVGRGADARRHRARRGPPGCSATT